MYLQFKIYKVPKEIPAVFHNGSTYEHYFIITQLPEEFKGQFDCLGENTEKYITFSAPIKKEVGKKEEVDNSKKKKTITYKIKFIDSYRFIPSKLSDLIDKLSEINKKKIKSVCDFIGFKNNRMNQKCKECGKNCTKLIDKVIKHFPTTY